MGVLQSPFLGKTLTGTNGRGRLFTDRRAHPCIMVLLSTGGSDKTERGIAVFMRRKKPHGAGADHPDRLCAADFGGSTTADPAHLHPGRAGRRLFDALFTATSATCVTGLVVQDTALYWSGFGQAVILMLIQIGGMGVVTAAAPSPCWPGGGSG